MKTANAFLFASVAFLAVCLALSLLPTASAEGEDSGSLTVYPGEDKTVSMYVPGSYDDTYNLIYDWYITDFADDESYFYIEDTNDGGTFANCYKVSSASDSIARGGGRTYAFHWKNDNSEKSFTVQYSQSYEYVDYSDDDVSDDDEDDTGGGASGCCCASIILAFIPLVIIAFIGYTKFKKRGY